MPTDRFYVNLQMGSTPEETSERLVQEVIRLTGQLNQAGLPVTVGPGQDIPEGMQVGQSVIDWSSGTSQVKVWNGLNLV